MPGHLPPHVEATPQAAIQVIPGYTREVKTAISIPDETFQRVERVAHKHGMKRSQFYTAAAERYANELEATDLVAAINAVADIVNTDESTDFAVTASEHHLAEDDTPW